MLLDIISHVIYDCCLLLVGYFWLKLDKFMSNLSNLGKICLLHSTCNIKFVSNLPKHNKNLNNFS
jgi:hypothetical protein